MASEGNPFATLRPALRSEEDDIRRGVFNHALRNLATATPEQKVYWHTANEKMLRSVRDRFALGSAVETAAVKEEIGAVDVPSIAAAGALHHKTEPSSSAGIVDRTALPDLGVKRERSDDTKEVDGCSPSCKELETQGQLPCPPHEAGLSIGAFLHAQVEKTVGSTLSILSSNTLRMLCMILGITTKSSNKDALYSMLASYHYTHCEVLGKRVSRSTFFDELVKQDCQSLQVFLKHPSKGAGGSHKAAASSPSTTLKTETAARTASTKQKGPPTPSPSTSPSTLSTTVSGSSRTGLDALQKVVADKATPSRKQNGASVKVTGTAPSSSPSAEHSSRQTTLRGKPHEQGNTTHTAESSDAYDSSDMVIAYPKPVLRRSDAAEHLSTSSYSRGSADGVQEDTEWTPQELEKSIATIVRNFDPVTTTIVIKKLAKMGYTSPNAKQVVESCLHSFHQKKYIYFESGIAYCLD